MPSSHPIAAVVLVALLAACAPAARRSSTPVAPAASPTHADTLDSSAPAPLGVPALRAAFDQVWRHIDRRYYDASHHGVDWDAVRARYEPALDTVVSDRAVHRVIASMVAELRDAHSRYLAPAEAAAGRSRGVTSTGAALAEIRGAPVVETVARGSSAERAGLRPGMRVLAVDDQPVLQRFAEIYGTDRSASSERARRALAWRRLLAGDDSSVRVTVEDDEGEPRTVRLRRALVFAPPRFQSRVLPGEVLYTRWDGFRPATAESLADALRSHADARGLVIDLRANGGGDAAETLRAIGHFLPQRIVTGEFFSRVPRRRLALFRTTAPQRLRAGGKQLWSKPVVILTGTLSGSGAEMMAAVLQEQGRAMVVGDTTCGCLTAITGRTRVVGGGLLEISDQGYRTARGAIIEGRGVIPDLVVERTAEDLASGRDAALERALTVLVGHSGIASSAR